MHRYYHIQDYASLFEMFLEFVEKTHFPYLKIAPRVC